MRFPVDQRPSHADTVLDLNDQYFGKIELCWPSHLNNAIDGSTRGRQRSLYQMYKFTLTGLLKDNSCRYIVDFLLARRGGLQTFLIRNPLEYRIGQQEYAAFGNANFVHRTGRLKDVGNQKTYQIYAVTTGPDSANRWQPTAKPIYRPVGPVSVFDSTGDMVSTPTYRVDYQTGLVYFAAPTDRSAWSIQCNYLTPVRVSSTPELTFLNNGSKTRQVTWYPTVRGTANFVAETSDRLSLDGLILTEVALIGERRVPQEEEGGGN